MTPPLVPGRVDCDAGEQSLVPGGIGRELAAQSELQVRAEGVVCAVEGVFGAQPLAPSQARELRALCANHATERVKNAFYASSCHRGRRCREPWILRAVRSAMVGTFLDGGNMTAHAKVIEVDDSSFAREVLEADVPVLVDFGATWCGPCKALAPIVACVAAETAGRVKVVTMDTDASPRTAERYGIRGVPTLLVFRKGEKTAGHLGLATRAKLLELLDREAGANKPAAD